MQTYGRHFESAATNGTCFQDPIGFIKFSISPELVPGLMDKDVIHKIFVSLRGIKQELYAKSFQVNDIREHLPPQLKTYVTNLKRDSNWCETAQNVPSHRQSQTMLCTIPQNSSRTQSPNW